ncbi:MAG: hypothetical protein P0116_02315 [Candidatus Nitrosocosmicus sp.]|nr:hypothetical protein [Candidatus Nitrosocosmicus sp.]
MCIIRRVKNESINLRMRGNFLKYSEPKNSVAVVKGAFRGQSVNCSRNLEKMLDYPDMMGMITTIIIGNSSSYNCDDMINRGIDLNTN